jgi:hypothetical protein
MLKYCSALALVAAIGATPAAASQWQTAAGAVVCPSYFAMKDGEAAADHGDMAWLQQTGCTRIQGGLPVIILQEPPLDVVNPWRVRVAGQTVYMRGFNVVGFITKNGKRVGPLPYHETYWKCESTCSIAGTDVRCVSPCTDTPHN